MKNLSIIFLILLHFAHAQTVDTNAQNLYNTYCTSTSLLTPITSSQKSSYQTVIANFPKKPCCGDIINNYGAYNSNQLANNVSPFIPLIIVLSLFIFYLIASVVSFQSLHSKGETPQLDDVKHPLIAYKVLLVILIICCAVGLSYSTQLQPNQQRAFCQFSNVINIIQNGNAYANFTGLMTFNTLISNLPTFLPANMVTQSTNLFASQKSYSNYLQRLYIMRRNSLQGFTYPNGQNSLQKFLGFLGTTYSYQTSDTQPNGGTSVYMSNFNSIGSLLNAVKFTSTIEENSIQTGYSTTGISNTFTTLSASIIQQTQRVSNGFSNIKYNLDNLSRGINAFYILVILFTIAIIIVLQIIYRTDSLRLKTPFLILLILLVLFTLAISILGIVELAYSALLQDSCNTINQNLFSINPKAIYQFTSIPANILDFLNYVFYNSSSYIYNLAGNNVISSLLKFCIFVRSSNDFSIDTIDNSVINAVNQVQALQNFDSSPSILTSFKTLYSRDISPGQCEISIDEQTLCGFANIYKNYLVQIQSFKLTWQNQLSLIQNTFNGIDTSSIAASISIMYDTLCNQNQAIFYQNAAVLITTTIFLIITDCVLLYIWIQLQRMDKNVQIQAQRNDNTVQVDDGQKDPSEMMHGTHQASGIIAVELDERSQMPRSIDFDQMVHNEVKEYESKKSLRPGNNNTEDQQKKRKLNNLQMLTNEEGDRLK